MIVHINAGLNTDTNVWEASIPGIGGAVATDGTMKGAVRQAKAIGLHVLCDKMMSSSQEDFDSVIFVVHLVAYVAPAPADGKLESEKAKLRSVPDAEAQTAT